MKTYHSKYIILGAGLSGLTTGYALAHSGESDFLILESRDRIGGRILTTNGIDFGATWFQNHHEVMLQMVDALGLQKFHQRSQGRSVMVYNTAMPAHYFESDPNAPTAFRVAGGSSALIEGLAKHISENIHCNTIASEILKIENGVRVLTNSGIFEAEKVIVTLPPQLASGLTFKPALPDGLTKAMQSTHTWMSNAMKVGLTFSKPFWRAQGLSGMVIGQVGAVTELYDHTNAAETSFSLMGFINEDLRGLTTAARKATILAYLATYLGEAVNQYLSYEEKDWSVDVHTSQIPLAPVFMAPRYGQPEFESWYLEECLLFSGAETATVNGGYMDGALRSGLLAATQLLNQ